MKLFPSIRIPGVDAEKRRALKEEREYRARRAAGFLHAMRSTGRPLYAGDVPASTVARRRAANRRAAASRRLNRTR